MTTHSVTIHLHKTKGLTVTPKAPLHTTKGDAVEWRMAGAPGKPELRFAVDFCPSNEASNNRRRSPMKWDKEQKPGKDAVVGDIEVGPAQTQTYHYAIAVWDGEDLYALDPEIRVGPRGQ